MQTVSSRVFSPKNDRQETFVVKEAILSNGCKEMSRGLLSGRWSATMMGPAGSTQREEAGDSKLVLGGGGGGGGGAKEEEEEAVTVEWREGLVFPPVAWKAPFLQTTFRLVLLFLQHDHEDEKNKHYFGKNNTLSPEPMVNIKADLDLHETDYLHFSIHNSYFPINISKLELKSLKV